MDEANEFTEVFRASNLSQGGAIRELLSQNGIDCYMNPSVPVLPWDGDVRVLCCQADAARARELIGAYLQAEPVANEDEDDESEDDEDDEDDEEDEDDEDDERKEGEDGEDDDESENDDRPF